MCLSRRSVCGSWSWLFRNSSSSSVAACEPAGRVGELSRDVTLPQFGALQDIEIFGTDSVDILELHDEIVDLLAACCSSL